MSAGGHRPSGSLAEAAQLFAGLRTVLNLTLEGAADLLSTEPHVISALETGTIGALPPWPETQRLVEAYTGLAGCDPGPVLAVLRPEIDRLDSNQSNIAPQAYGTARHTAPQVHGDPRGDAPMSREIAPPAVVRRHEAGDLADTSDMQPAGPRWRKGRGGRPVPVGPQRGGSDADAGPRARYTLKLPAKLPSLTRTFARILAVAAASRGVRLGLIGSGLALALLLALCQPRFVHLVSSRLPDPMAQGLRSVHDYLLIRFAPEREGLRWIEVSDPRARRTDKLHNGRQND